MNPSTLSRIKQADADALRPGVIVVGNEKISVLVQTFGYDEFQGKIEEYKNAPDVKNWEFLAGLFFDIETREKLFSPEDLKTLKAPTVVGLFKSFHDVNMGVAFDKKK